MSKKKKLVGFEEKLERLEFITNSLENDSIALEESIKLFEEGVILSRECLTLLQDAELKVEVLKKQLKGINDSNED